MPPTENHAKSSNMRTVRLPSGRALPVLGQGTWGMGEDPAKRQAEISALRLGLDLNMTLIDTAEMYGEGGAEEVIAEAIAGRRTNVFLVSKVYPHNATRTDAVEACERSLRRLKTEYLDLYLLHWRGSVPLTETFDAFRSLKRAGKIRDYGVSNFDFSDMEEASAAAGSGEIATNQVLYNLRRRGVEWDVVPWCRERAIPVMAYSPIDQSTSTRRGMLSDPALQSVASRHGATPTQVALAWLLQQEGVIVIPKASHEAHVREDRAALELMLTDEDRTELDQAFPPPHKKTTLDMR
jgi:diketogulonate reductase-like aldo/keto reductase